MFSGYRLAGRPAIREKMPRRDILFCRHQKIEVDRRLRGRGQDSEEGIAKRMAQAVAK